MALATIPEAIRDSLHVDEPAEETVTVVIHRGDKYCEKLNSGMYKNACAMPFTSAFL